MDTLGARIRSARERKGLTQTQLAKRAGCGQSVIGNLESEKRFSTSYLLKIAAALDVSPHWLESGDDGIVSRANLVTEGKPDGSHQELLPRQSIGPTNGLRRFPVLTWTDSPRYESATPASYETLPDKPALSQKCFAVVMQDSSMQMSIPRGNTLLIDPDRQLDDGGAYLFDGPSGPIVRRVRRGVSGWMLLEEDGRNSPAEAMPGNLKVVGRVVMSTRMDP